MNISTHSLTPLTRLIYCTLSASMLKLSFFLNFSQKTCRGIPFAPTFQSRETHPHLPPIKVAKGGGGYTCPFALPVLLSYSSTILFVGDRNCFLDIFTFSWWVFFGKTFRHTRLIVSFSCTTISRWKHRFSSDHWSWTAVILASTWVGDRGCCRHFISVFTPFIVSNFCWRRGFTTTFAPSAYHH